MFSAELFVQSLIAGIVIGVIYALMALGITFIYSIVKMINWAMGEFYMIGELRPSILADGRAARPDLWCVGGDPLGVSRVPVGLPDRAGADQADVHRRRSSAGTTTPPW